METSELKRLIERANTLPKEAQQELIRSIHEIESRYATVYRVDEHERAALERSLTDVRRKRFATSVEFDQIFSRFDRT